MRYCGGLAARFILAAALALTVHAAFGRDETDAIKAEPTSQTAQSAAQQAEPAPVPPSVPHSDTTQDLADRILVLDRTAIRQRYGITAETRVRYEQQLRPILTRVMAQYGANLIMERTAFPDGADHIDVTPLVLAAMDKLSPPLPSAPPIAPAAIDQAKVSAPLIISIGPLTPPPDYRALADYLDPSLKPVLDELMSQRGANLVLDRQQIVLSSIDIDVTRAALSLIGKRGAAAPAVQSAGSQPATRVPAPRILIVDRNRILSDSKVGQDIKRQIDRFTGAESKMDGEKAADQKQRIQSSALDARRQIERVLGPILHGIMVDRGANVLIDRKDVVIATVDVDVTTLTVERLDEKLPSLEMTLPAL